MILIAHRLAPVRIKTNDPIGARSADEETSAVLANGSVIKDTRGAEASAACTTLGAIAKSVTITTYRMLHLKTDSYTVAQCVVQWPSASHVVVCGMREPRVVKVPDIVPFALSVTES